MPGFSAMAVDLWTARLALRQWRESDAERYRALWLERDPRSLRRIGVDGRPDVTDLRENIRTQLADTALTGLALLAIERRVERDLIGYCGLTVGGASIDEPEIAFELQQYVHGQGYATEAASAVLEAARATGRRRLWGGVRAWNTDSLRVLDKLGFVDSGRVDDDREHGDMIWLSADLHAGR